MRKFIFLFLICVLSGRATIISQNDPVLLRINGTEVLRSEFEYAYKDVLSSERPDKKRLNELAKLFVINKLKIQEAQELKLDTAKDFRSGLAQYHENNLRKRYANIQIGDIPLSRFDEKEETERRVEQVLVSQLFKYLPQNTPLAIQRQAVNLMDSLFRIASKSPQSEFTKLVNTYSDEKGQTWIRRKQMPKEIEDEIFSLPKGGISRPFQSPLGLHIIKALDKKEYPASEQREKTGSNNKLLLDKAKSTHGYSPNQAGINELYKEGKTNKLLFTLKGKEYTGKDFERFSNGNTRSIRRQFDRFVIKSIVDRATVDLGSVQPEHNIRFQAYKDSLLLDKITEERITRKSNEKAGLQAYFSTHKKQYKWDEPRFRGVIIHCDNKKTAKRARKLVKKKPVEQWSTIIQKHFNTGASPTVIVEQGVFAKGDNPYTDKLVFKEGSFTPIEGYPYTSVIGKKDKKPETVKEAGNSLQADYRDFLESLWLSELCRESKVEINQEVLKTVNNH